MKKVALILSNINKALAFEWIAGGLKDRFDIHFILLYPGESEMEKFLLLEKIKVLPVSYRGKKDFPAAVMRIRNYLKKEKIETVHAHLLDAGMAGLLAAKMAGVRQRIYTRHHATSHHVYHPHAVRYDKWINRMATKIVATSENVKQVLMEREQVPEEKIVLIHHGFDLAAFQSPDPGNVRKLEKKYNAKGRHPVIGVISRYIELKGIQYTVEAFRNLLAVYPDALLILANATGKYKEKISALLQILPEDSYLEIPFENDLVNLYRLFDVHVHVPVDRHSEAFGQTYVEALAAGIPSVFTLSGVAPEFIRDHVNALVVPYRDSAAIEHAVVELLENPDLCSRLIPRGKEDVGKLFGIRNMLDSLAHVYAA